MNLNFFWFFTCLSFLAAEKNIIDARAIIDTLSNAGSTPRTDPVMFCYNKNQGGRFAVEGDTTGTEYILCYNFGDHFMGYKYSCSVYFNPDLKMCQRERP